MFKQVSLGIIGVVSGLCGLVLTLGTAAPVGAQTAGQLPGGSWQQTCSNIRWDGAIIVAECRDVRGEAVYTRWDSRSGHATVQNCNGDLVATTNCQSSPSMRIPPGSWRQQACDFGRFDGSVMVAYCYSGGESREIRFDTALGSGPLELCSGQLARAGDCSGRKPVPAPVQPQNQPQSQTQPQASGAFAGFPSGSWQNSCQNPRWEDRLVVATCQTSNSSWVYASFDTNRAFFTLSNCDGVLVGAAQCPS